MSKFKIGELLLDRIPVMIRRVLKIRFE